MKPGNRLATYLVVGVVIVIGISWYFSTLDGPHCAEADTGRCELALPAMMVTVVVLATVMPCVVYFGEMFARDRRKRIERQDQ
jgi:hypothetical protein